MNNPTEPPTSGPRRPPHATGPRPEPRRPRKKIGCIRILLKMLLVNYAFACAVVYVLPVGGWANQRVLDKKLGRTKGHEALIPTGHVEQAPDQSVIIRALYGDTATPQVFCVETTVSPSTMRTLISGSIRKTADGVPIVEITECLVVGDTTWVDQLPPGADDPFATWAWHCYSPGRPSAKFAKEHACFIVVRQLTFGEQPQAVAFEGRSHYYEIWASWSTAAEKLWLIPATCWDVLSAPVQIPCYLAGDIVHAGLSLGDPGNDNPWRGLDRPSSWPSPRILDPAPRQVLITAGAYDDILYRDAESEARSDEENRIEIYRRYIGQFPDGRNVAEAEQRISLYEKWRDKEEFDRGRHSLSLMTQFVERRPSSNYAPQAIPILETMVSNVAVMNMPEEAGALEHRIGDEFWRGRRRNFTVGMTTRAEVEAFIGCGEPAASPAGAVSFTWQIAFWRGDYIPAHYFYPNENAMQPKPLTLTFGPDGILTEIEGE